MKFLKTAFRFAPILSRKFAVAKLTQNKYFLPSLIATSYAFMYASQKVLN